MEEAKRAGGFKSTLKQDLGLPSALVMPPEDVGLTLQKPLVTIAAVPDSRPPGAIVSVEGITSPA